MGMSVFCVAIKADGYGGFVSAGGFYACFILQGRAVRFKREEVNAGREGHAQHLEQSTHLVCGHHPVILALEFFGLITIASGQCRVELPSMPGVISFFRRVFAKVPRTITS